MSSDDNVDLGVQHRGEGVPKCPPSAMNSGPLSEKVAGVTMNSMPMFRTSSGSDPFFSSGWDPLAPLHHSAHFGGSSTMTSEFPSSSYPLTLENEGVGPVSHMNQYSSSSGLVDMVPKLPCYGSGNFSDMVASFGLSECGQVPNIGCLPSYSPNDDAVTARAFSNGAQSQDDCQLADDTALGASFSGRRRKRGLDFPSPLNPNKSLEVEQQKELLGEKSELQEELSDKKQKAEQETGTNNSGKQLGKQSKDNSSNGDPPKDNYVHVRAKRGQATNSHSLAERVRREKISERMKMLQELVPGCNKITGKAVMLDEIINYVQSLQQQVEFLSMKLATVNPELNIDIERLLSKDVLHSRGSNAAILGFGHGMNSPHPYPHGISPGSLTGIPSTGSLHPMPQLQALWDNDLHNVFQTGYNSNPNDNIGPSGRPKSEV